MQQHYKITHANIKEWAKNYDGEPFDGILCDPPYELSNDGKASANRVFFEFMFPEYSNRNTETLSESELSFLIKQVLVLGLVAGTPSVSTTMPVSTVTLDKHSLIREIDVKDGSELSEVVSKYDGTLNGNPELNEHIANIHFKLTDTAKLFKVLNEIGSGFYSGGIGVGFSITPTSLPSFLASSRAVVSAYESIGLSDDSFAELVLAGCRTENETVLRFDLSEGLVNERSAITTLILFAILDIAGAEFIRTYTAAGSLPTKFKSTDIGFISNITNRAYSINCLIHTLSIASVGFMGKEWDGSKVAFDVEMWKSIYDLLKPGGHLLAFSGSRTYHRMAVAIEDAGFEIRDMIEWVYGSGFPKSLNIGKAVDKIQGNEREVISEHPDAKQWGKMQDSYQDDKEAWQRTEKSLTKGTSEWEGYGTALKPAHEPCVLARKPLDGTVANNCLKHGTGGLNIDGTRVGTETRINNANGATAGGARIQQLKPGVGGGEVTGRFPANLIHDGSDEVEAVFPQTGKGTARTGHPGGTTFGGSDMGKDVVGQWFGDSGSASRFFYTAKASKSERNAGLEGFDTKVNGAFDGNIDTKNARKIGANPERQNVPTANGHPTVKPLALTKYLATLIKPPTGGRLLVPFSGSGSEMIGALQAGWEYVEGVELTEEYIPIAEARIKHWTAEQQKQTEQLRLV